MKRLALCVSLSRVLVALSRVCVALRDRSAPVSAARTLVQSGVVGNRTIGTIDGIYGSMRWGWR